MSKIDRLVYLVALVFVVVVVVLVTPAVRDDMVYSPTPDYEALDGAIDETLNATDFDWEICYGDCCIVIEDFEGLCKDDEPTTTSPRQP